MPAWTDYPSTGEVGSSWTPPELGDDLYDAVIDEVSEPFEQPKFDDPSQVEEKFWISWRLTGEDVPEDTTLRQYVAIPPKFRSDGFLSAKANLYLLMDTLGFDLSGRFEVDPPSWVGMKARVMIENKANRDGVAVPKITSVKPPRQKKAAPARQPQPVAAGAGQVGGRSLASRVQPDEDED